MTKKATPQKDSLATFTASTAESIMSGGYGAYRDAPLPIPALTGYIDFYRTSWICRAAVDGIPEDCFKRGYQWVAETDQIGAIDATERRLSIQRKKQQALSFSRLDGEAYLYIDTGEKPDAELLPDRVGRDRLRFVNVFRKSELKKGPLVKDPISQYHKQPEYYEINSVQIHPSRIIRFVNNPDPDTGDGVSVLTYMLAPIIATETARDNVVALTTEACLDILSVEGLMDAVSDPETEALAVRRYSLFRQMKRTNAMGVIDKEKEAYEKHFPSFSTLPEVIETMRREAAAAIGKPYALLFGNSGGIGNNGSTEIQNYYDDISTVQRNTIQPVCAVLDEVVIRSALGSRPPEIYIEWASLWEMSDKEKADVAAQNATAAKTAVDAGIVPADVLTEALINSWVEIGAFQGIEQGYADWIAAGGELDADETDDVRGDLPDDDVPQYKIKDAAPRTLYVSRKVVNSAEIIKWAKSQGFKDTLKADDLHVTIAYSRTPVDWMSVSSSWQSKIEINEGGPRVIEQFGDANVILFHSHDLEYRHDEIKSVGASWDYPEYQPHITVSYGELPENVKPYTGNIILGPEIFEEVNQYWGE